MFIRFLFYIIGGDDLLKIPIINVSRPRRRFRDDHLGIDFFFKVGVRLEGASKSGVV